MNRGHAWLGIAATTVAAVAAWLAWPDHAGRDPDKPGAAAPVISGATVRVNPVIESLSPTSTPSRRNVRPGSIVVPANRAEAMAQLPFLSPEEQSDGRHFIRYDLDALASKAVGEPFDIYVPNLDMTVEGRIDEIERNGETSHWSGALTNLDDTSRFFITQAPSDSYAIGMLQTPEGTFEFESKNGYGWMRNPAPDFKSLQHDQADVR